MTMRPALSTSAIRRAPLRLLALDHDSDILLHHGHRTQQRPGLALPAGRDRRIEFAPGDAIGDGSRRSQRSDDAPRQE
jgi:hypothetical protein